MPRVSVVIASYNHERFVRQAVESVLGQTFGDIEVCITDDGSSDATPDVIAGIRDERIRFNRFERNRGISAALNDAIRRSSGEFIAELNSDDYFLPDKIAIQVGVLESNPAVGAVFGYPAFIDDGGRSVADDDTFYKSVFRVANCPRAQWLKRFFYWGNCLCQPTLMARRRCHDEIGLYDERLAQVHDLDLYLRILGRYAIHVVPEALTMFRILGGEKNASAPKPAANSRTRWETERVLRHYLTLDDALFAEVFAAEIADLGFDAEVPRAVQLGRIAVLSGSDFGRRFGLELLYDAIPAQDGPRQPAFSARELIALSGDLDLYFFGYREEVSRALETQRRTIEDLETRLGERNAAPSAQVQPGWSPWWKRKS
jgi:glycosyltransferase involved in cell wall biosynthesis